MPVHPKVSSPGRYLIRSGTSFLFQIRIPKALAQNRRIPPFRIGLGPVSKRTAQQRADRLAVLARQAFAHAQARMMQIDGQTLGGITPMFQGGSLDEVLAEMRGFMKAAALLLDQPEPLPGPRETADLAALKGLVTLERELRRGAAASPLIADNVDMLRARYHHDLGGTPPPSAGPAAAPAAPITPVIAPASAAPPAVPAQPASTKPLFSRIADEYIAMRIGSDGPDHKDVKYLELRKRVFLEIVGDKPVDTYKQSDLQLFVNELQFWPANVTKRTDLGDRSIREILDLNRDRHLQPLSRKTAEDGYVQNIRTMFRHGCTEHDYRYPFADVKIRWPLGYRPSVPREGLSDQLKGEVFRLGVASGLLDEAMLPLLGHLSGRRLGLLCYLRGSDIREKHGVYIAQTDGIVFHNNAWQRVPYKTQDSMTFFVLHKFLAEIGFIEWARAKDGFLFDIVQEYADPEKQTSGNMNDLLRRAGAVGKQREVFHCLRHGLIDHMRNKRVDPRARRLQAGHELGDEHEGYGSREISPEECRRLARLPLSKEIDWSVFRGLDFEALSKARRQRGRRKKD